MEATATVPITGKTRRREVKNKNAKVMWITTKQQFNVAACHDVPWALAHQYAKQMKSDPRYKGGILVVTSMETLRYNDNK